MAQRERTKRERAHKEREHIKTRLRARGQLTLPNEVREVLNVDEGDEVVFSIEENGRVIVTRSLQIPPEQAWFWSERWQKLEREAQADIDAGRVSHYTNVDEAISDLERLDDAGDRAR
jgi:AbrB family looped-hinge helix DNA binding protein